MAAPPAPSLPTVLLAEGVDVVAAVLVAAAGTGYAVGVRRLAARGRRWRPTRTAAYFAGLALVVVATQSGLARYDDVLFSAHVGQHLVLGMLVPVLLVAGAPLTLALQAGRPATTLVLRRALHHPVAAVVGHPVVAAVAFTATPVLLYLTPLFEASLRHGVVHAWVHVHMVVVGYLWAAAVIGVDPHPNRLPHGARLAMVGLTVPGHAVLGMALLGAATVQAADWYTSVGRSWGASPHADQRTGAGLMWGVGELFAAVLAVIVLARWMASSEREATRADRALDAAVAPDAADALDARALGHFSGNGAPRVTQRCAGEADRSLDAADARAVTPAGPP